jgi:hypothetical protein
VGRVRRVFRRRIESQKGQTTAGMPASIFTARRERTIPHESTTDPDARLYRKGKGKEAKLSYTGHVLMENRNGLAVDGQLTQATGTAEREAAVEMLAEVAGDKRVTLGTDKAYDTHHFVEQTRAMNVTPHATQNTKGRSSAIDGDEPHSTKDTR